MNKWEIVAALLGVGLLPCLAVCALTGAAHALVAVEVASVLVTTILMVLSEAFQRQPFIDLALTFALLSLVGSLAFARLMERNL